MRLLMSPSEKNLLLQRALTVLSFIGILMVLGWLLKYSAYGIDFTDESLYLVWISNPFIYSVSVTQFGFIYHPLYILLGGDIAVLRQANILITLGLAWSLVYAFLTSIAPGLKNNRLILLTVSAGVATSVFFYFHSWLPTPSYNSLALQSLLISGIGLLLIEKTSHCANRLGALLIGAGGWLAFMAKPSTALALALGVFVYMLFSRKFSIRMLLLAIASALVFLLASALLIDRSILRFVERICSGLEFARHLGGGHTLSEALSIKKLRLLIWLCLILGALCAATLSGRIRALKSITVPQWAIAFLFLAMPYIYAFGTNTNYLRTGISAAIFWLLSGQILLSPLIREASLCLLALLFAISVQVLSAIFLWAGLEQPYRQPQALRLNTATLEIGPQRSALVLSETYAKYITSAVAAAQKSGFEHATPVIDLSGQSPGILYALGAENIGQAWTIGGYPGSLKLAESALAYTPCEKIANAWVLFEPDGPRSIPAKLMSSLGADFPGAYKKTGTWQTAEGVGGYATPRIQELYKPTRPQHTQLNCQALRAKGSQ